MEPQPRLDVEPFSWPRAPVLLADRLGVRPAGLIGGIVAVLAAAVGGWWALRPPPPPVEDSLPRVVDPAAATTLADELRKLFVVSDNEAYNRCYDVAGPSRAEAWARRSPEGAAVRQAAGTTADASSCSGDEESGAIVQGGRRQVWVKATPGHVRIILPSCALVVRR